MQLAECTTPYSLYSRFGLNGNSRNGSAVGFEGEVGTYFWRKGSHCISKALSLMMKLISIEKLRFQIKIAAPAELFVNSLVHDFITSLSDEI